MFRQQRAAMLPNNELCEWEWHLGNHLQTPSMHTLPMPLEVRDPLKSSAVVDGVLTSPACSSHAALPDADRAFVALLQLQHTYEQQSMLQDFVGHQAQAGHSSSCSHHVPPMLQERRKRNRSLRLSSLEPMGARSRRELQQLGLQGPAGPPSRGTSLFWESSAQDLSGLHPLLVRPCCPAACP